MFKSKHSGWTYDLKRTPFGGGGGIGNAFGLGDALASIDPGPAIGSAGASLDKTVNDNIPGGWITVGALAAGGLALAYAPEVMALAAETGVEPAIAAEQLGIPAVDVATGEAVPLATTATPSADAVLGSSSNIANLTPAGAGNFGSIVAPLEGSGAIPGAGAITNAGGLTGAMGAGTMVGDGTLGTTIGQSYMSAAPGQFALNAAGSAIPAGAAGIAGTAPSGMSALDILNNANRAKNLSQLLSQGAASGLSSSLGKLAQGANPQGQELGAVVRGNQNPFTYQPQQPIQNAKPLDLASLANLLKQG
jgi:hypothetical protein